MKTFKLELTKGKKSVFTIDSKAGDSLNVEKDKVTLTMHDQKKCVIEKVRFDGLKITSDEKTQSIKVRSYTYKRDNEGNSVICFS